MHPDFELDPGLVYLNHAGVAPWPRATRLAVEAFAAQAARRGGADYPRWLAVEARLRARLARLVGAESADCIALVKNTSEALSIVAGGLDWQTGDNVVYAAEEFPSNRIVWEALAARGVEPRCVPLQGAADPEGALLAACDRRTRLLAVSSVQYASGLRMDLERLGQACRARGVLFCVDAIQSLGALPFDARAVHADFVAADGHKWLLAPEGLGLFYCRSTLLERLAPLSYGWHMVAEAGDFERRDWRPAPDARRFECGSPNLLGVHALDASTALLEAHGLQRIARAVEANVQTLIDALGELPGTRWHTPLEPARRAGILTVSWPQADSRRLHAALDEAGILCALRGGGLRFSPHYHNDAAADAARLCEALARAGLAKRV
ncbi:MAG: hypothetical protein KatS3mg121_0069 [Gammaproteobacteria bacterium]|nr:MAG: hypothetical protein KatS3mg121_0069 [Gammaproteobacteria bacterium]